MMPGSAVATQPAVTPVKAKRAKASKKSSSTNIDLTNESILSASSHDTNNNTANYLNYNVQNANGVIARAGQGKESNILTKKKN